MFKGYRISIQRREWASHIDIWTKTIGWTDSALVELTFTLALIRVFFGYLIIFP